MPDSTQEIDPTESDEIVDEVGFTRADDFAEYDDELASRIKAEGERTAVEEVEAVLRIRKPRVSLRDERVLKRFLETLAATGELSVATHVAWVSDVQVYALMRKSEEFAQLVDSAREHFRIKVFTEARRRAFEGVRKAVWHKGKIVGVEYIYDSALFAKFLAKHWPELAPAPRGADVHVNVDARQQTIDRRQVMIDAGALAQLSSDQRARLQSFLGNLSPAAAKAADTGDLAKFVETALPAQRSAIDTTSTETANVPETAVQTDVPDDAALTNLSTSSEVTE